MRRIPELPSVAEIPPDSKQIVQQKRRFAFVEVVDAEVVVEIAPVVVALEVQQTIEDLYQETHGCFQLAVELQAEIFSERVLAQSCFFQDCKRLDWLCLSWRASTVRIAVYLHHLVVMIDHTCGAWLRQFQAGLRLFPSKR